MPYRAVHDRGFCQGLPARALVDAREKKNRIGYANVLATILVASGTGPETMLTVDPARAAEIK